MKNEIGLLAVMIVGIVALVVIGPFFTMWSLNTVFGMELEMSWPMWLSIMWLAMVIRGVNVEKSK